MVNKPKPEWFLAPRGIAPDTTIVLGKIIADPRYPTGPPKLARLPIESEIFTQKYPYYRRDEHGKGGKAGVFLSFLSMFGVGTDTEASLQLNKGNAIDIETLETRTFEPDSAYVQRVLDLPENVAELAPRKIKPLYIITGVQTAFKGTIENSSSTAWSGHASIGVSPNVPGMDVGVKGGLNRSKGLVEIVGSHDFVYAFKLNKIAYSRKTGGVVLDGHTRGAAFEFKERIHGDGGGGGDSKATDSVVVTNPREESGYEVRDVEMEDAGSDEFGVEGVEVDGGDGDESCIVIDPSKIADNSDDDDDQDD